MFVSIYLISFTIVIQKKWKTMYKIKAECLLLLLLLLLLPNTDRLQQVEDYVRGCSTSTKYWSPSTSWRLCQRLFYLYQILTAFNKLKIMSEVVLPLPNTDCLQQVEDYVRGCSTSTKYWLPSTCWRLCQVVLPLPNTDCLQQVEDYVRGCSTSTKYWLPSTSWRLCQRLFYLYQILTAFNKLKIMSEVVLPLPNTDCLQQVEDYVRGCSTSTKYWLPSTCWRLCQRLFYLYQILTAFNKLKIMSEVVLPLLNTDHLQQVEDYVRGCSTSTKYWLPSTSWRLCQRLFYLYQILTAFNKLKIMSEVVLPLPNTDRLQQVEDYVRGCSTSTKYWPPSTCWRLCQRLFYLYQILTSFNMLKIMSEVVLPLPNTDRLQQVEDYVRGCSTSTKYWPPSTCWRLCQRLFYLYQILTSFNMLKIMSEVVLPLPNTDRLQQVEDYVRGCSTSTKYWPPSTCWRLCQRLFTSSKYWPPSTCWRLCQRLFYLYQILIAFNKLKIMSEVVLPLPNTDLLQHVEDYVRGCSTSTKYWPPSTSWRLCQRLFYRYQILTSFNMLKIMSEVVLPLPNTDRLQHVEDYVRGCSTSSKYWPPSTCWRLCQRLFYLYQILTSSNMLKIMSEVVLPLPNTDLLQHVEDYVRGCSTSTKYWPPSTCWRLCQRLFYLYQILAAFNKLKIMSEVVHGNWKG